MHKYQYGSTAAAIYLAENLYGKPRLSGKLDAIITAYNARIADIAFSNLPGHTKVWCMQHAFDSVSASLSKFEAPISTLAINVAKAKWRKMLCVIATRGDTNRRGHRLNYDKRIPTYEERPRTIRMKERHEPEA